MGIVDRTPKTLLRYALSYLEKAHNVAPPSHFERAQVLIAALRQQLRNDLAGLADELRRFLREQSALGERATAGRIRPDKANALNREILAKIARARAAVADLNAALGAESASDLGGFVDLPIEEYAPAIEQLRTGSAIREGGPSRIHESKSILSALIEDEPTIAGIQLKPTPLGLIVWAACIVAALVATLLYLGFLHLGAVIDFHVAAGRSATDPVIITIGNNGNESIDVLVPLPEGGVAGNEGEAAGRVYGLRVWTREEGGSEYRLLPASVNCWMGQEPHLDESRPLTIAPRLSAEIRLDPAKLAAAARVESLRIALVHPDGRVAVRSEITLPTTR